jgi:hypothetical protein
MILLTDQPSRVSAILVVADAQRCQAGSSIIATGPEPQLAPTFAVSGLDEALASENSIVATRTSFDWNDPRTFKAFARLQAKILAEKADEDEKRTYVQMRNSKRETIGAKTYMLRYAETERLKSLSKKLQEIEKFLKPIPV